MKAWLRIVTRLVGAAAVSAAAPVAACGFHGALPDLVAAHPRSIDVALATRDAFEGRNLEPLPALDVALGWQRVARIVHQARPVLGPLVIEANGSIAVLLIESGLWTRYTKLGTNILAQPHVHGPVEHEPVVVTSEATLGALIDGSLTAAQAMELGVLVFVAT
jgi:hypothetical protein